MPPASSVILIIFVTGAMASDIHRGRIYNHWLVPAFVTGIMMDLYTYMRSFDGICGTAPDVMPCPARVPAVFILIFIPYVMGGLGAGDVKLATAGSVFMTFSENIVCLAQAFLLAGIMAVFMLAEEAVQVCRRRDDPARRPGKRGIGGIPFAVPYALSVILMTGGVTDIFWQQI